MATSSQVIVTPPPVLSAFPPRQERANVASASRTPVAAAGSYGGSCHARLLAMTQVVGTRVVGAPRPFGRLLTAMVTPMKADGSLDVDGAAALAVHLVDE